MDLVGDIETGHDAVIAHILPDPLMGPGAIDAFRNHIFEGDLDFDAGRILADAFQCIDRPVPAYTAPVLRMRCVSIWVQTARVRENQLASHFVRGMNRIDNMSLPTVGVRIRGNNIAVAMNSIKHNIIYL